MTVAEILRSLLNVLDSQETMANATNVSNPQAVLPQDPMPEKTHTNDETGGIMVPPLQQKMELLKKVAGVDNVYDQAEGGDCGTPDELDAIKKNAGIPMLTMVASEDNDIGE